MSDDGNWDGVDRRREEALIGGMDFETHREQHRFIEEWIEEIKLKRERREKLKTQVMGWSIITILGSIGTAVYHAIIYLRDHLK